MKRFIVCVVVILMCTLLFANVPVTFADTASDDLSFAVNMGFIDEGQDKDMPVTRAELAAIYYNIVFGDDVESDTLEIENQFSDVSFEDAGCINFVNSIGVMKGIGNGLFSPDGSVTYIQLLKSMICFLGYADMAEAKGGYPFGYLTQAAEMGIDKGGAPSMDALVTFGKVASVLKLAINVNVRHVSESVKSDISENYLKLYKKVEFVTGVLEGTDSINVNNKYDLKYHEVLVDGKKMSLTKNTVSLGDKIGYKVRVYFREEAGETEILHYEMPFNNKITEISIEDLIEISNGTISYYTDDNSQETLNYKKGVYFVYNNTLLDSVSKDIINKITSGNVDGRVKALDNNGDRIYDFVFINLYETLVVDRVSDSMITNVYKPYVVTELDKRAPEEMIIVNVYGERIKHTDIEPGDVINVEKDLNGKVTKITVTVDKFTGVLEALDKSATLVVNLTIDGITYPVSNHFKFTDEAKKLILGDTVTAYFNKDGKVARLYTDVEQEYKIGYLIDAAEPKGLDGGYQFRVFTTDGEFEVFTLSDRVYVNDTELFDAKTAYEKAGFSGGRVIRQPIRYKLFRDKISKVMYCDKKNDGTTNGIYMFSGFDGATASPRYKASMMTFSGKLLINGTTVMFKVPEDANRDYEEGYYTGAATSFIKDDDISKKYEAYGIEANSPFAKIIVQKTAAVLTVSAESNMTLVEKVTSAVAPDGEEIHRIYGINNNTSVVYEAKKKDVGELSLVFGDVIRVYSEGNYVRKAVKVLDYKDKKLQYATNPSGADFYQESRFMYGSVKRVFGESILVEMPDKSTETVSYEWYPVSGFKIMVCDEKNKKIYTGTIADIYDEEHFGKDNMCDVLLHTRHGNPRSMVVYK